ncbi:MAG: PIG-L family deacetylase [Opitutaceae bacterium]|nr:PIG-L family deacetylase [Opitutaceae bacterium]
MNSIAPSRPIRFPAGEKLAVAAFGAHPDDIESGMAGTLMKYKEAGHDIYWVIATDGRRGGKTPGKELAAIRRNESLAAAAHFGLKPVFLDFEDGRLVCDAESYNRVIEIYDRIKPDIVFTHDPNDYHPDHRAISRLVTDASWVPVFYADTLNGINFAPEFYVNISDHFERKAKALREHKSQEPEKIFARMELQNRFRALQCMGEVEYAEAFRLFPRADFANAYQLLPV